MPQSWLKTLQVALCQPLVGFQWLHLVSKRYTQNKVENCSPLQTWPAKQFHSPATESLKDYVSWALHTCLLRAARGEELCFSPVWWPFQGAEVKKNSNIRSDLCCVSYGRESGSYSRCKGQGEMDEEVGWQRCLCPVIKWTQAVIILQTFARLLFKCCLLKIPWQWQG